MFVLLGAAELKSKDRKMTAVIFVLLGAVKIKSQHRKVITVMFVVLGAVKSKSNDRTNDSGHCCSASSQSNNLSNQRTQGNQCTLFLSLPLSLSLSLSLRFRFPLFVSSLLVSSLLYFLSLLSSPFSFRSSLVFILCLSLSLLSSPVPLRSCIFSTIRDCVSLEYVVANLGAKRNSFFSFSISEMHFHEKEVARGEAPHT